MMKESGSISNNVLVRRAEQQSAEEEEGKIISKTAEKENLLLFRSMCDSLEVGKAPLLCRPSISWWG